MIKGIKLKEPFDSSLAKTAISLCGIGVLAPKFAHQFEVHVSEIISNSDECLRAVVHNKISIIRPEHERSKTLLGKMVNRFLGKESEYIELSGIELIAAARLTKEDVGIKIFPKGTYRFPLKEAERLLVKLDLLARPGT